MRIVGVDAALGMSGLCSMKDDVVEDLSIIWTRIRKATPTESKRLEQIFLEFQQYLRTYQPDVVIMENSHVNKRNPKTSVQLGRVRGVYQVLCALEGIPLYTLEPSQVKNGAGCKGNADKKIIQEAVVELYDQPLVHEKLDTYIESGMNKTDDMADALALCHSFRTKPEIAVPA